MTGYAQTSGGVTTPATAQWYVYDGLGSVVGTVKPDGTVTSLRSYDPYGAATDLLTDTSGSSHKYVGGLGHPTEDQSGLIYMRARFMDPAIGRFISEDPAHDGTNWFAYADNNPINKADINGKIAGAILVSLLLIFFAICFAAGYGSARTAWNPPSKSTDWFDAAASTIAGSLTSGGMSLFLEKVGLASMAELTGASAVAGLGLLGVLIGVMGYLAYEIGFIVGSDVSAREKGEDLWAVS